MPKINKAALSIPVIFERTEEVELDDVRFTKLKIWLMHTGKNANGSVFDKDVVNEAIPTLGYIPIVGFIEDNKLGEEDFSDHRYVLKKTEDGLDKKYEGVAYGVIMSSADNNAHFEERLCDDGVTREFLVVDGLTWNMFEESTEILHRDIVKSHSMELWQDEESFDGYEDENGYFHFTRFSFRAACILGNDYEPAMANSTVEVQFTMSDFVNSLHNELNNKYTAFTKAIEKTVDDNKSTGGQGGITEMPNTDFQTVLEMFSEISAKVEDHEKRKDRWGDEVPRYYAVDVQDGEIIVVDGADNWNYYGLSFEVNGDEVVIDWESSKRKKIAYEDYQEATQAIDGAFNFGEQISKIEETAFQKVEQANGKVAEIQEQLNVSEASKTEAETNYEQLKANYDEMKPKYDEYVKAEKERKEAEISEQKDTLFARYEKLIANEQEFIALKEKKDELSVRDIEVECSLIYSRKNLPDLQINYSKSGKEPIVAGIDASGDDNNAEYVNYERYAF